MKVYEYFSSEYCWYFVEEYVAGGDLYEQICKLQYYNEETASNIMKQIFSFVCYLHQMNIVHRDIKPKNMMVSNKKDEIEIKLIDFGTATFFSKKKPLTGIVGTPIYMAPEVLKGNYYNQCDLWSCGVILYILLGGNPPFEGKNSKEIYSKIEKGDYNLKGSEWENVSDEAKDLIKKLLEKNINKRITAQEALKHPFITNNAVKKNQSFNKLSLKNCLQTFASKQKLHQASIAFIVHQMSNNKMIQKLTEIFKELDESGEGLLSKEELKKGYKKFFDDKITDNEFDQIMKTIDQDNSGQISIEEFIRATVDYENLVSEKNLKSAFDFFDKDHSGSLSPDEVREVLGLNEDNNSTNKIVENIIKEVDVNGDGLISYDEFKTMMKNNKSLLKN
jgi:calcium-dependent protein kinase